MINAEIYANVNDESHGEWLRRMQQLGLVKNVDFNLEFGITQMVLDLKAIEAVKQADGSWTYQLKTEEGKK